MVQREIGPIPPEFCLWKPMEGDNEGWYGFRRSNFQKHLLTLQRYYHAVTKAKSRIQASETGGGILADEMGMGKSLSILALITKTLESSYNWKSTEIPGSSHTRLRCSRATLVIVPSASMFPDTSLDSNHYC
jgi:SNF2 family DNA or RNA helicase